jgi:regulator of protease activity HflC (stomatin/prohibitin superfamily)
VLYACARWNSRDSRLEQEIELKKKEERNLSPLEPQESDITSSLLNISLIIISYLFVYCTVPVGKFKEVLDPGFHCLKCWPFEQIAGRLSLRIQQFDVFCETKSKDNVSVVVAVAVQYRVIAESASDAFYRLPDARGQIQRFVFDMVRSTVPEMEHDEAFASQDKIADAVLVQLKDVMNDFRYEILNTSVSLSEPPSSMPMREGIIDTDIPVRQDSIKK